MPEPSAHDSANLVVFPFGDPTDNFNCVYTLRLLLWLQKPSLAFGVVNHPDTSMPVAEELDPVPQIRLIAHHMRCPGSATFSWGGRR